jgi:hypothetical protein
LPEFIAGLFCVAVGAILLAAVGHGLWVATAAAIRWLSGSAAPQPSARGPCPACGSPSGLSGGWCVYCSYQSSLAPEARFKSDLETTSRVLDRWAREGVLDPDRHGALQAIVALEREKLGMAVSPAPPAETLAVPAPAAPLPREPEIIFAAEPVEAEVVTGPFAPTSPPKLAEVHPLDRDYSAERPAAVGPTLSGRAKRRLADVLKAFMEESNIRWGEIVAGLLIVGSAIGCVVSLQETLRKADPYVPAFAASCWPPRPSYGAGTCTR